MWTIYSYSDQISYLSKRLASSNHAIFKVEFSGAKCALRSFNSNNRGIKCNRPFFADLEGQTLKYSTKFYNPSLSDTLHLYVLYLELSTSIDIFPTLYTNKILSLRIFSVLRTALIVI